MNGIASRRLALEVLLKVELEGAFAKLALDAAFKRKLLEERDRAFVTFLVQGVIRHQSELDAALQKVCDRPLAKMPAPLRNTLRLAAFQVLHAKDIPASAVLNTASQIAKDTGHIGSAKFTNAVMRSFLKAYSEQNPQEPKSEDSDELLSESFSLPIWLVKRWRHNYGNEEIIELLKYSQTIPTLTLRACQMSISTEGLQQILESKSIKIQRGTLVDSCLQILERGTQTGPIEKLPGFSEGLFTVQDEAAAFVSLVACPSPGQFVIDLCAAPGGKSLHLAEMMENTGRLIALDIHPKRLNLLNNDRQRLGLTNIEIMEGDGRTFRSDSPADLILIDAPCSGTGVINRRSDLRHRREEPDIHELVQIQRQLLENASSQLKETGSIVYSTCSMEPEENSENIKWFLDKHPEFRTDSLIDYIPEALISRWAGSKSWEQTKAELESGMIQLLPSRHGFSGFFISRLIRT